MNKITTDSVYTDYKINSFVFKYYNQFFKLNKKLKKLEPISGSKVNDFVPIYKISVIVGDEKVNPANIPVVYVEDEKEYGIVTSRDFCIDPEKVVISIKLLSSYFGIDRVIEKTMKLTDTIKILSFKKE